MFLQSSLLRLPSATTPFLNGGSAVVRIPKPHTISVASPSRPSTLTVEAMKKMQGRVVSDVNDKTVAVEVVRLAPHPKYKRRVRVKKKYQAHDPLNQFKIGDFVQLEKSRPISKTKTFIAIPVAARNAPKYVDDVAVDLGLPLQSDADAAAAEVNA